MLKKIGKIKINLAKSAGFCFGVKRAIDIALKTSASDKKVFMLGDIVHNEDVVKEIQRAGIIKIKRLQPGRDKTLLIRAHGAPQDTFKKAYSLSYKLIDATCPMVKEIHKIAKDIEESGYQVIVIGDKLHDEVQGIVGQLKTRAIIIDDSKHIPIKSLSKIKKAGIVVQSTQNLEKVIRIADILKRHIRELKFFNTICNPTRMKQLEIKSMPKANGLMIIIGSKTSANTKRLYEISKLLNKKSYWISSAKEIKPLWLKGVVTVGVTAGASTPDSTTKEVIQRIKQLTRQPGTLSPAATS